MQWQFLNVFWWIRTAAQIVSEQVVCWKGFLQPIENLCRHQLLTVKCELVWMDLMSERLNGASYKIDSSTCCRKPAQLQEITEDQEYLGLLQNKSTKLLRKLDLLCSAASTPKFPPAKLQKIATSKYVCRVSLHLPTSDRSLTAVINCWGDETK